jgi:hypothetical protein
VGAAVIHEAETFFHLFMGLQIRRAYPYLHEKDHHDDAEAQNMKMLPMTQQASSSWRLLSGAALEQFLPFMVMIRLKNRRTRMQ